MESHSEQRSPVQKIRIKTEFSGMRLDRFIRAQYPILPLSALHRLLRTGQIRVNGGRAQGGRRLFEGDEIRLPPMRIEPAASPPPFAIPEKAILGLKDRILYRDAHLLVLNKPCGMAVHAGSSHEWGTIDALRLLLAREEPPIQPELIHRLDKETSGCLLFGLTPLSIRFLTQAFREGGVKKEYLTLVRGMPKKMQGTIQQNLIKNITRSGERMVVTGPEGDPARTEYCVLKNFNDCALLLAQLKTGRTHQIRVHLQWLGHPVAGDRKYGDREFNQRMSVLKLNRLFLHAWKLTIPHPESGQSLQVEAPMDPILTEMLTWIEKRNSI
ncbi:MAG: RluA family pseudouridine synthase [Magnetococcus sp. DMHC-6]